MRSISQRPYQGPQDLQAMLELVLAFPQDNQHVCDLPYRLCSWALDENVGFSAVRDIHIFRKDFKEA